MKNTIKIFAMLLIMTSAYYKAQSQRIERYYLQNLSESFIRSDINTVPTNWFWSKCIGETVALSDTQLYLRYGKLVNDKDMRADFYMRVNFYLSSNSERYFPILKLIKDTALLYSEEELKGYFNNVKAYGEHSVLVKTSTYDTEMYNEETRTFTFVEQIPDFTEGSDAGLVKHLKENIIYPNVDGDSIKEGKVLVTFVVRSDGGIANVAVSRSVSPSIDAEAIRLIKMLPPFKPGMLQGKPVNVFFSLPIVFKFQ